MTRPAARVLALLEILQGGGTHTAADLAERLGVDERTVRRYVEHLLDLEMPVESVRGRYGGFRLAPGFRMPPLMLTDEEALAVLLGLVTGPPTMPAGATESAAAKVRRVLPKPLAARLEALFANTEFTASPPSGPLSGPGGGASSGPGGAASPLSAADRGAVLPSADRGAVPEAAVMLRLAEAARLRRPVLISYRDRAGRRSGRTLHPYGLVAHAGRWYVTGADSASGEVRTFRLDRIEQAQIIHGTFAVPDGFAPADAVLTSLAGTPWRHQVVVAVRGTVEEVRARLPQGIATVAPDAGGDPGWVLVRLRAERLDWLPALLAGLGLPFAVQEPEQLRDVVRAWADRIAGCAAATAPQEAARAWEHGG